jgi:hypothetical protein
MSAEIKIKTPFTDYQTIDLSITHSGSVSFKWCCDNNVCTFSWLIYQEIS